MLKLYFLMLSGKGARKRERVLDNVEDIEDEADEPDRWQAPRGRQGTATTSDTSREESTSSSSQNGSRPRGGPEGNGSQAAQQGSNGFEGGARDPFDDSGWGEVYDTSQWDPPEYKGAQKGKSAERGAKKQASWSAKRDDGWEEEEEEAGEEEEEDEEDLPEGEAPDITILTRAEQVLSMHIEPESL